MGIDQFLKASALANPEKIAFFFENESITYGQLDQEVNNLAQGLIDNGLKANDKVAVILGNCSAFVKIYFAIMRAGGAIVPLNLLYKEEEIKYILKDADIQFLVIHQNNLTDLEKLLKEFPALKAIVIGGTKEKNIIPYEELLNNQSAPVNIPIDGNNIAACLYTSGTSGKPKGALLTHGNLMFLTETCRERMGIGKDDSGLCFIPLAHIFSLLVNMLIPVYLGATFTILPQFIPQLVLNEISKKKITYFAAVPAMYGALLSLLSQDPSFDISSLKLCVSGGSPLPIEITKIFNEKYGIPIIEGSGPTEAVACLGLPEANKPGTVGLPFRGVEVKIIDENEETLPPGEVGEFCVRGPSVMQGYLNLPEVNAVALKGGWFHTGDLAKIDEDGYVSIIGRKKDMILVGGFNVYPAEVEQCLCQHPKVLEAAVIGIPDKDRGEIPKAFIVLKPGMDAEPKEFILYCRKLLANYKCPREVVIVEKLPKNEMGKIDKKLL
ncbi:MAG: long-chain fatty acid--CoA ligase [Peptococcaceae bacterium]|nr:long-chain fatty acid--CoA ligase [Peptococcaceae bacterium]